MFDRFTDRSRETMVLANHEARRLNHEHIGTEHILLGLVREGSGIGVNVLKNFGIELAQVRSEVEKVLGRGRGKATARTLRQTQHAGRAIEYAIQEARGLGHNYVGTEHLLLGLLRETEGRAHQILINLGPGIEEIRQVLLGVLGVQVETSQPMAAEHLELNANLAAVIKAAIRHLPDEHVTPGRLILALLEAHPQLAARLAPVMDEIRRSCEEP
jgi:ATP-dependent Clp protease ATP-binding subunit ClpC